MKISIIVSVYNEEEGIEKFHKELHKSLCSSSYDFEIIYVNDGSSDRSSDILVKLATENSFVKTIEFSRNFGHEAAMIAGIDFATGDAILCMDADLQHPPHEIQNMINCFISGYDIITMTRSNVSQSISSRIFYKLINLISPYKIDENASDFFMISSKVADILRNNYRERIRFLRGLIQIIGFKKTTLSFEVKNRISGKSKYSNRKLVSLTLQAIGSLSTMPLKTGVFLGSLCGIFSILLAIFSIVMKVIDQPVSGYTTIIVFLGFMFSFQFLLMGIIGEYIGFIFNEQKQRPIYIVDKTHNIK